MKKTSSVIFSYFVLSVFSGNAQESALKPVFDKSILDISGLEKNVMLGDDVPCKFNKMILEIRYEEYGRLIDQGLELKSFTLDLPNKGLSDRQIFTFTDSKGACFTVINRNPVAVPGVPQNGVGMDYGTSASFDFNRLLYRVFYPKEYAFRKKAKRNREIITKYVYP